MYIACNETLSEMYAHTELVQRFTLSDLMIETYISRPSSEYFYFPLATQNARECSI